MDKQILNFTVNEQILVCENPIKISTNKVNYIQASFDLGENWDGFDSVRAIWFNDFQTISTVLDSLGNCVVPFEVMKRNGEVKVNLVGSISENDVLTDRLTSYPVVAVIVDCTAQITGANTSPITPSEYEQFVAAVHEDAERAEAGATASEQSATDSANSASASAESAQEAEAHASSAQIYAGMASNEAEASANSASEAQAYAQNASESATDAEGYAEDAESARDTILGMRATANTLSEGSDATASYSNGLLTLGIPRGNTGAKGDKGDRGDVGATPNISIGTVTTLDPDESATATISGTAENPILSFGIPKGDTGEVTQAELDEAVTDLKSDFGGLIFDGFIAQTSANMEQGSFEGGTGKYSATKRIRLKRAIYCKANTVITFPNNGLYTLVFYLSTPDLTSSASIISQETVYTKKTKMVVPQDCYVYMLFANGWNYSKSTTIVPSDYSGEIKFIPQDLVGLNISDVNDINTTYVLNNDNCNFNFVIGTLRPADGKEDSGTARIRSDYIRVGKDSIVVCNNPIANTLIVYEYDKNKGYIQSSAWTGGNRYTVLNDGYIRILERKNASDATISSSDVDGLADYIEIYRAIPQSLLEYVAESASEDYVPTYFQTQLDNAISSIRTNLMGAGINGDAFAFITDLHWESNQKHSPNLMRQIVNNTNIGKVICGGDIIGGGTKAKMIASMSDCVDSFKDISSFYALFGNHDTNTLDGATSSDHFTKAQTYSLMQKQADFIMDYGDLCYFCFDNPTTKTRFICMDTGVEGTLLSSGQSNWLTATLDSMPDNYHALIFAHILYYPTTSYHIGLTPAELAETDFATALFTILDAYNADNSSKVEAIFGGHLHIDANFTTNGGIPIVLTDCDARQTFTETSEGSGIANHAVGTVNEQCFDVTTIDYTNRTIKCVRIGRGSDRTITY